MLNQITIDPTLNTQYQLNRQNFLDKIQQINNTNATLNIIQPNNYVIPVVVHVIGGNLNNATNVDFVSQAQINAMIAELNLSFSNALGSIQSAADDAQITFCLAQNSPTCGGVCTTPAQSLTDWGTYNQTTNATVAGVTRYNNANAITVSNGHNMSVTGAAGQQSLTGIVYFNADRYLNIWIVNNISLQAGGANVVVGYSPYPLTQGISQNQFLDGVVIRPNGMRPNANPQIALGRVIDHEVGHYLNLLHTFQDGCVGGTFAQCNQQGDECCDTPPEAAAGSGLCTGANTCFDNNLGGNPVAVGGIPIANQPDMCANHMGYYNDVVRNTFTDNQSERMHAIIQSTRAQLVSPNNMLFTGLASPNGCLPNFVSADFFTSLPGQSVMACTGNTFSLTAIANANFSYTWTTTGSSLLPTNTNVTTVNYPTAGTYTVGLVLTDNVTNIAYSNQLVLYITDCSLTNNNNANWYFGNNGNVAFTSAGVTSINHPNSINSVEASANISDNNGNLIFYTDGIRIWNQQHIVINAGNLMNGSPNLTAINNSNGVVIVPKPGNNNRYLIYTTSDKPSNCITSNINNGLTQYEVLISGSAPNYTITPVLTSWDIHPVQNYITAEGCAVVPACDGINFWLICKGVSNNFNNEFSGLVNAGPAIPNTAFLSYLITANGISAIPVISASTIPSNILCAVAGNARIGTFKASPNKKIIAYGCTENRLLATFYFDCETGILNQRNILGTNKGYYGTEFSPNSEILYAVVNRRIEQFDLTTYTQCAGDPIHTIQLNETGIFSFQGIQRGPDNKIYIAKNFRNNLDVIAFPDNLNDLSNPNNFGFVQGGVTLNATQLGRLGLPNDITASIGQPADDFQFCVSNCGVARFTAMGCGTTFTWNFGDGTIINGVNSDILGNSTTTGNFEYPVHTYSQTGNYLVTLEVTSPSLTHTITTHFVNVTLPPPPTITGNLYFCGATWVGNIANFNGNSVLANPTYNWNCTNCNPTTFVGDNFATVFTSMPSVMTLTVTDANGCQNTTTTTIATGASTINVTPINPTICVGGSVQLYANDPCNVNATFTWSPTNTLNASNIPDPIATPTVTTTYTVTSISGGNTITTTVLITVIQPQITATSLASCTASTVTITPSGSLNYTILPGASFVFVPSVGTIYTVEATDAFGCKASTTVIFNNIPIFGTILTATYNCPTATGFTPVTIMPLNTNWQYSINNGSTWQSSNVFNLTAGNYTVTALGGNPDNCTTTLAFTIYPKPSVTIASNNNCQLPSTLISTVVGGTAPFYYYWSNGNTNNNLISGIPGVYTLVVKDANSCTVSSTFVLSPITPIVILNLTCAEYYAPNNPASAFLGISTSINGSPYTYNTLPSAGITPNNSASNLNYEIGATTYTTTVTNVSGCSGTSTYYIAYCEACPSASKTNTIWIPGNVNASTQFPSGSFNNQGKDIVFLGQLNIDQNTTFSNSITQKNMFFNTTLSNQGIDIANNKTILIDNWNLRSCQGSNTGGFVAPWRYGIVANTANETVHIRNSTLQECDNGIQISNKANLVAHNNVFDKNGNQSILVQDANYTTSTTTNCTITKNTFKETPYTYSYLYTDPITSTNFNKTKTGIRLLNVTNASATIPVLRIGSNSILGLGNKFDGIANGIYVENNNNVAGSGNSVIEISDGDFYNIKNFTTTPYIKATSKYQTSGIRSIYTGSAIIGNTTTASNTKTNLWVHNLPSSVARFYLCDKGIVTLNSSLIAEDLLMDYVFMGTLNSAATVKNYSISRNVITNCFIGAEITGADHIVNVTNNSIITYPVEPSSGAINIRAYWPIGINEEQISPSNVNASNITGNTIDITGIGGTGIRGLNLDFSDNILSNTINFTFNLSSTVPATLYRQQGVFRRPELTGVWLLNAQKTAVAKNTINGLSPYNLAATSVFGMRRSNGLLLSQSPGIRANCNQIYRTWFGAAIQGNCLTTPTAFATNLFQWQKVGISFDNVGTVVGDLDDIGTLNIDNNNKFAGGFATELVGSTPRLTKIKRWNVPSTAFNRKYYKENSNTNATIVDNQSFPTTISGLPKYNITPAPGATIANANCVNIIPDPPPCFPCPEPQLFYNEVITDFATAVGVANGSYAADITEDGEQYKMQQILYRTLQENPAMIGVDADIDAFYTSFAGTALASMDEANTEFSELFDEANTNSFSTLQAHIASFNTSNQAVSSSRNAIATEKQINTIYYKWLTLGMDSLTPSDSAVVDTTAKTCSILGGPAVFKARMLYSLWNASPNWDDVDLCTANAGQNKNKESGGSSYTNGNDLSNTWGIDEDEPAEQVRVLAIGEVNVYPNPSSGLFTIKYNLAGMQANPTLCVYDITGKMVLTNEVDKNSSRQIINLSAYSSGVYTIEFRADGLNYKTKITLLK